MLKKLLLLTTALTALTYALFRISKYRKVTTSAKEFHTKFTQELPLYPDAILDTDVTGSDTPVDDTEGYDNSIKKVANFQDEAAKSTEEVADFQNEVDQKYGNQGPQ